MFTIPKKISIKPFKIPNTLPEYHIPKKNLNINKLEYKYLISDLFNIKVDITNFELIKKIINDFITTSNKHLKIIQEIEFYEDFVVIGDLHGNIFDLQRILIINNEIDYSKLNKNYIILGDFIDRGGYSFECSIVIFLLKILNPNKVYIIRGNHELIFSEYKDFSYDNYFISELLDRIMIKKEGLNGKQSMNTKSFFTYDTPELRTRIDISEKNTDLKLKYRTDKDFINIVDLFKTAFQYLPIAIKLTFEIGFDEIEFPMFFVHGGIPKILGNIDKINEYISYDVLRSFDVGRTDYMNTELNFDTPKMESVYNIIIGFCYHNASKELGFTKVKRTSFGPNVTKKFLEINDLQYIFRGHQPTKTTYFTNVDKKILLSYRFHKAHGNKLLTLHSNSKFWKNSKFNGRYGSFAVIKYCGDLIIYSFNESDVHVRKPIKLTKGYICTKKFEDMENNPVSNTTYILKQKKDETFLTYLCKLEYDISIGDDINIINYVKNINSYPYITKEVQAKADEYKKFLMEYSNTTT